VCARSTAEVIGLTSDIFHYCRSSWNIYQADGILDHLILVGRKALRLALTFKLSKSPPQEKIQDRKKPENEDNSIHGGGLFVMPQSYGTASPLSRTP
jgi:hypothetical protein